MYVYMYFFGYLGAFGGGGVLCQTVCEKSHEQEHLVDAA